MKAGVISRTDLPDAANIVENILKDLKARGFEACIESETAITIGSKSVSVDLGEMNVDFAIVVGGDGSILRTGMLMRDPSTPILGVNLGTRGFLTEVHPSEVSHALDRIREGDYRIEECYKLSSRIAGTDETLPDSINEVLVASSLPSKVIDMNVKVEDENVVNIQADGLIVATPTGSTAYSLSAGGSILAPEVSAMIITAICPDSYFHSIVIPSSCRVKVELVKPRVDALLIIDGRVHKALNPRSIVEIWRSPNKVRFIRFRSFYNRLNRRLQFRHII
ncbi:MAG: NAD(+)/NADH kinase [Candidatus Bathyarchaeia archaeon]